MDYADWNRGLLSASLLISIATMAIVAGRTVREKVLAVGILTQGILMLLVAGQKFFPQSDFEIGAIAFLVVCWLWSAWVISDRNAGAIQHPVQPDEPGPTQARLCLKTQDWVAGVGALRETPVNSDPGLPVGPTPATTSTLSFQTKPNHEDKIETVTPTSEPKDVP